MTGGTTLRALLGDDWARAAGRADWRGLDGPLPGAFRLAARAARTEPACATLARVAAAWGREAAAAGRHDQAEVALSVAWEMGADGVAAARLAELRLAVDRPHDAFAPAQAAWSAFRDGLGATDARSLARLWTLARAASGCDRGAEVVDDLRRAEGPEANFWLGVCLLQTGATAEASRRLHDALRDASSTQRASRLAALADLADRHGDAEEALRFARLAVEAEQDRALRARRAATLARRYAATDRLDEALAWADQANDDGLQQALLERRRRRAEADGDMELARALTAALRSRRST